MLIVIVDTCVLWPSTQRDFLLSLALEQIYRPVWSSAILDELEYHEAEKLCHLGVDRAEAELRARKLVAQMRAVFVDAEVTGWERLEGTFGLPDEDDEHVLAAAVLSNAGAIVTENFKDFPVDKLPPSIEVISARDFARDAVSLDPVRALKAISELAGRSGKNGPRQTPDEILEILENRYGMDEAVQIMRTAL